MGDDEPTGLGLHRLTKFPHHVDFAQDDGFEFVSILFQFGEFDLFEGHPMVIGVVVAPVNFAEAAFAEEVFGCVAILALFEIGPHYNDI